MGDDAVFRPDRRDPSAPPEGRRGPSTQTGPDGELFLSDAGGREWVVYDRRVGQRRRTVNAPLPPGHPDPPAPLGSRFVRAFVARNGETREYLLAPGEILDETPTGLARQLAGASEVDLTLDSEPMG